MPKTIKSEKQKILEEWLKLKEELKELHPLLRIKKVEKFIENIKDKKLLKEADEEIENARRELIDLRELTKPKEAQPITPTRTLRENISVVVPTQQKESKPLEDTVETEIKQTIVSPRPEVKEIYQRALPQSSRIYGQLERLYRNLIELRQRSVTGYARSRQELQDLERIGAQLDSLKDRFTTQEGIQRFNRAEQMLEDIRRYRSGETAPKEDKEYRRARKSEDEGVW